MKLNKVPMELVDGSRVPSYQIGLDSDEEMRTIYFALREYADVLEKRLKKAKKITKEVVRNEELMFLYNVLSQINKALFDLSTEGNTDIHDHL